MQDAIWQRNRQHSFKSLLITKQSRWQIKSWTLHLPCLMNSLITQSQFWCISAIPSSRSHSHTSHQLLQRYLQEHVARTVSWSWLINTCFISGFYGDGLNYVSIETDFLSDHSENKLEFFRLFCGQRRTQSRQTHRREINTAKQQHPVQWD